MTKPGHIRIIDGKLKFEYFELSELDSYIADDYCLPEYKWKQQMKEYKASKRTVEVSNKYFVKTISPYNLYVHIKDIDTFIKNNQPCKAKVNGKAKIIELIK